LQQFISTLAKKSEDSETVPQYTDKQVKL